VRIAVCYGDIRCYTHPSKPDARLFTWQGERGRFYHRFSLLRKALWIAAALFENRDSLALKTEREREKEEK